MPSALFRAVVGNVPSKMTEMNIAPTTDGVVFQDSIAGAMSDFLSYAIPAGTVLHFTPADFLAALLNEVTPVALDDNTQWELVARAPGGGTVQRLAGGIYGQIQNFVLATEKKYLRKSAQYGPAWTIAFRVNGLLAGAATAASALPADLSNVLITCWQECIAG